MQFTWKPNGKIFKGVGIYHLTFRVAGPLKLGTLSGQSNECIAEICHQLQHAGHQCDVSDPSYVEAMRRMAHVQLTPFGKAVEHDLSNFEQRHPGVKVCQKIVMDTHIHLIVWVQEQLNQSILEIAQGFRTGITHIARDMGVWPIANEPSDATRPDDTNASPYHIFEIPFVRTLSHSGQLRVMIDYVILNPFRRWMQHLHPQLFTLHKNTTIKGLSFRSMGNHWLLDWPERQVVECSRNISNHDLQCLMQQCLYHAETGAITYTCAISKGEQYIARTLRESGYPLVVLLLDGFPPQGTDSERHYKPGGVYFDTCSKGQLLLMEAHQSTYNHPQVITLTDATIKRKDEEKGHCFKPLSHDSKRWRMIAGNEILHHLTQP